LKIGKPCQFEKVSNEGNGWRTIADKLQNEVQKTLGEESVS